MSDFGNSPAGLHEVQIYPKSYTRPGETLTLSVYELLPSDPNVAFGLRQRGQLVAELGRVPEGEGLIAAANSLLEDDGWASPHDGFIWVGTLHSFTTVAVRRD
jgi:hypothetical protein